MLGKNEQFWDRNLGKKRLTARGAGRPIYRISYNWWGHTWPGFLTAHVLTLSPIGGERCLLPAHPHCQGPPQSDSSRFTPLTFTFCIFDADYTFHFHFRKSLMLIISFGSAFSASHSQVERSGKSPHTLQCCHQEMKSSGQRLNFWNCYELTDFVCNMNLTIELSWLSLSDRFRFEL